MKKIVRIGRRNKLAPLYVELFEILDKVRPGLYWLVLPPELKMIHNVIHISKLRRYTPDFRYIIPYQPLQIQEDISYVEKLVQIMGYNVKQLRNKMIPLVKVLWRSQRIEEATWEPEEEMRRSYPHLL